MNDAYIKAAKNDICPICGKAVRFNEEIDYDWSSEYGRGPHEKYVRCPNCKSVFKVQFTVAMLPVFTIEEVEHITSKEKIAELYGKG